MPIPLLWQECSAQSLTIVVQTGSSDSQLGLEPKGYHGFGFHNLKKGSRDKCEEKRMGFEGLANATLTMIGTDTYRGPNYSLIYEDDNNGQGLDYSKAGILT